MWLGASTISKVLLEVNASSKLKRSIGQYINVQGLEVGGRIDYSDIASLNKVVGHDNMFLVGSDFDVVGTDLHAR